MVIGMSFIIIGLSRLLGKSTHNRTKDMPYESGIAPTGNARLRMAVPYYLVAILFLMFDVEVAFLYAWGISIRELGWDGFAKAMLFIGFLSAGLIYVWLKGGLEWRRPSNKVSNRATSSQD